MTRGTHTLLPGGSITSLDKVQIHDDEALLNEGLEIFVERIDPAGLDIPIGDLSLLTAESKYYRIGAAEYYRTPVPNQNIMIRIPLRSGAATENLAVFVMSPDPISAEIGQIWTSRSASYSAEHHEARFNVNKFYREGTMFVIVSGAYGD